MRADATGRPRRGKGGAPGGLPRFSAGGPGGPQETDTSQTAILTPSSQMQLELTQQQQQQMLLEQQQQQLLQGIPEGLGVQPDVNDEEERERLRLRKERRKQKKDRKRARREQKLQQQQQQQQTAMGQGPPAGSIEDQGVPPQQTILLQGPQGPPGEEASAVAGNDEADFDALSSLGSADGH